MDHIHRQTRVARRRLTTERFLGFLPWTISMSLVVALGGLALPKTMHLAVDPVVWFSSWVGGCAVVAIITNFCLTFVGRPSMANAAVEIDRRFKMRERLSSALVLTKEDRETELGEALVADANARAEELDVRDAFQWGFTSRLLLPVLPAALAAALWFIPNMQAPEPVTKKEDQAKVTQVKNATKPLLKKIKKMREDAEKRALNAAVDYFKKLEGELGKLQKDADLDTKQSMAKLNDIKQQLKERREELGSSDELRKNLQNLEKFEAGPAEKLANALKNGDFQKAEEALQKMLEKMQKGEMSKSDMEKLQQQLDKLQKAMSDSVAKQEMAKQQLQDQIKQAQRNGDMQKAAQLQRKLEEMQAGESTTQQMQQMAGMLQQAQQAMQDGDMQQASEAMEQMAAQLQQMNQSNSQLKDLNELMDSLSQSKSQMNCKQCNGKGCTSCQMGMGQMPSQLQMQGNNLGEGAGSGDRPEEENEVDFFDSQVREKMRQGEIIKTGDVWGPNKKGETRAEVQEAVLNSFSEEPEPLDETPLPKMQREHASSYFHAIREGK